mmetsp:Transcript_28532/g.62103  ORF Transcript_28532/g.62103 Transcript_28532/m.62103 type:complete len:185 (-) Transcript_28532:125-679(-)
MPHTISGKTRVNRPDSRPNAKRRRKERAAAMESAKVEELRATSIPKSKQKERRPGSGQKLRKQALPPEAKRARYLQKLLRQIEALKDRKEAGEKLDLAQRQKLARMDEVVGELEELFGVNLDSSSDEEAEAEDDADDDNDSEQEEEGDASEGRDTEGAATQGLRQSPNDSNKRDAKGKKKTRRR